MIRPSRTITQPTIGLGSTLPLPRAASSMARRMKPSSSLFSLASISGHLWLAFILPNVMRLAAGMQETVENHQTDAGAKHHVGDVEDPWEQFGPARQGVDHVADIAEDDAVVHISQHAGQEHAEDDLIEPLAAAVGEEIDEK